MYPEMLLKIVAACSVVVKCQLTPRGTLSTSSIRLVGDAHTLPSLQFGDDDKSAFRWEVTGAGELKLTQAEKVFLSLSPKLDELLVTSGALRVENELRLAGDFVVRDFTQWRLFAAEQFSSGNAAAGWDNESKDLITECAGLYLLGGFGKFCKGEISKTFDELPGHKEARVKANFHFIDRWNGEVAFMRADIGRDGSMVHVWTDTHTQDTSTGINVCGGTVAESKFSVPVEVVLPHTSDTLRIGFGSTIENDDPTELSWGISSLEIHIR